MIFRGRLVRSSWLVFIMLLCVVLSLTIPLPAAFVRPVFSNLVLLSYFPFEILFLLASLLWVWILARGERTSAFLATILISSLYFLTWESKIPGGIVGGWDNVIPDHWGMLVNGGFNSLVNTGFEPVIFTMIAPLTNLFGYTGGLLCFSLVRPIAIGAFSYLIALNLTGNPRISSLATVMSFLADPFFITPGDSIYAALPNGIIYFLVGTYVLLREKDRGGLRAEALLVVMVVVTTLEYPLASVLLVAEAIIVQFSMKKGSKYGLNSLVTFSLVFLAWNVFSGSAALLIQLWVSNLVQGVSTSSAGYHSSELFTHLFSFFGNQPGPLLPFSVLWLSLTFVLGSFKWLWTLLRERNRNLIAMFSLPMYVVAIPLMLTQGGFAEYRVFFYLGLFLSITLLSTRKLKLPYLKFLAFAMAITALPTLASTLPQVGFNVSQYSTNYAAGSFLHYSPKPAEILTYVGVMATSYVLPAEFIYAGNLHYSNGTQYVSLVGSFSPGICGASSCQFATISPMYFASVNYQFGSEAAATLNHVLRVKYAAFSEVYNNGVTSVFW